MSAFLRLDQALSWAALCTQADAMRALDVRAALAQDPNRVAAFSQVAPHV